MEKAKLEKVLTDKAFLEKIFKMEKIEEVQKAFLDKGVELSKEEIQVLGKSINKILDKGTTALSDEDLEDIAGGIDAPDVLLLGLTATIVSIPVASAISAAGDSVARIVDSAGKIYCAHKNVKWEQ